MHVTLLNLGDIQASGLTAQDTMSLVRTAYASESRNQVDVPLKIGIQPSRPNSFLDAMPAWVNAEPAALGMKWVSYFPGNEAHDKPDSSGLIVLNHPTHGLPVCVMEGMHVTFIRTTACAAVMAQAAVDRPPQTLALVGCGGLGKWSLRMFAAAFPSVHTVYVSSRTAASRQQFCADMADEVACKLIPVDEMEPAVRDSDLVISSLPPCDTPPIQAAWLKNGAVYIPLDLVHAWQDEVYTTAQEVVADSPAYLERLLHKHRPQALATPRPITQFQTRPPTAPNTAQGHTLLAVCGIASTDVVVGWEIYRRAKQAGLGTQFNFLQAATDKSMHHEPV